MLVPCATEDAAATVQPWLDSTPVSACELCLALQQNSPEMEQRALSHALWFQLIREGWKAGGGYCCLSHPSSLWQFLSVTAIYKAHSDVK